MPPERPWSDAYFWTSSAYLRATSNSSIGCSLPKATGTSSWSIRSCKVPTTASVGRAIGWMQSDMPIAMAPHWPTPRDLGLGAIAIM